jgi:RHS repeat-associated protein
LLAGWKARATITEVARDQTFARVDLRAANASERVLWYLTDHLNSVRLVLDESGTVLDQIAYDAFGNIVAQLNPLLVNPILFTSREFDAETGLYYNRARYLDPSTGRWTTQDPLGFAAGDANLYRYVGNTPTLLVDPSGYSEQLPLWVQFVNAWDNVLGHHRIGWFAQGSNFFAGWGDTLSFGLTSYARQGLGYDDVVDYDSGAYFGGQVVGTGYSFVIGWYAGAPVPASGVWAYRATQGYTVAGSVYGLGHSSYVLATDPQNFGFTDVLGFIPLAGYGSRRLLCIRFYRGSTHYDVVETVQNQAVNIERLMARQSNAILDLGPGLYLTGSRQTAQIFAELQGGFGRQGGPAVLGAEINRFRWWWLRWHYGARGNVPISHMPGHYQDHVPYEGINYFNRYAYFWQERIRWAQPIR